MTHPLDPPTLDELQRAVKVVGTSGRIGERPHVCLASLEEPPKETVLAWGPGEPAPPRRLELVPYSSVRRFESGVMNADIR